MSRSVKIPLLVLGVPAALFAAVFSVYFFNLDMKLLSKFEPILLKHYDKMPRDSYI